MNSLSEFTNELLALNASIIALSPNADTSFSNIDKFLDKVIAKMRIADDEVLKLTENMALLNNPVENTAVTNLHQNSEPAYASTTISDSNIVYAQQQQQFAAVPQVAEPSLLDKGKTIIGNAQKAIGWVDDGMEMYELAGGNIPDKFKKGFKAVKTITNVLRSAGEVIESAEGIAASASLAEGTLAVAETGAVLAGIEGVAAGSALFGPPGWIVSWVLTAGIIAYSVYDDIKKKDEQLAKNAEEQKELLYQKQYAEVLPTFSMNDQRSIDGYVYAINERKQYPAPRKMQSNYNFSDEVAKKYDPETVFLNPVVPVQKKYDPYQSGVNKQPATFMPNPLIESYGIRQRLFDVGSTQGREALDVAIGQERTNAKNRGNSELPEMTFRSVKSEFVNEANKGKYSYPENVQTASPRRYASNATNNHSDGKTIIINLNKAMIEHFTVNAKEIKEGVNEFKHKVEEVLLEILNSANTH